MRNVYSNTLAVKALNSGTVQTGTVNGAVVDTGAFSNNFRDILFVVTSGTLTDGTYVITAEESDQSGSGFAAVDSWRVLGPLPSFAATDDDTVKSFGVRPNKRYVRLVVTATGATTGGVLVATAVLGAGGNNPVARS
ncbi:hypothetical protein BTO20_11465 [Mycobacterium dioxanotrophicus]|uniref:Uncharacterized protein n=1 Tax=Mycobacterium dioxanotrophicus TaxID=482462 RepID=A0A1Y0C1X7_9MYCO|nr:hypothetical protein [Mycobacterium dioxanotrophicus]ART69117.1 hypothetical protein BTO20_11465 [Mycobacterium dioxanotrophicus]